MRRALTVRPPWAQAIMLLGKDVENRKWLTNYRGRLYIHAGLKTDKSVPPELCHEHALWKPHSLWDVAGAVIGYVELVDCITDSDSEWAEAGLYHWVLRDPQRFKPRPMRGALGIWAF